MAIKRPAQLSLSYPYEPIYSFRQTQLTISITSYRKTYFTQIDLKRLQADSLFQVARCYGRTQ